MHKHAALLACALALAGSAQSFEISHKTTGDKAAPSQPMAWSHRTLAAGMEVFERRASEMAPGATLSFVVPHKADPAPVQVQLVSGARTEALPLRDANFTLPREAARGAQVVTNRRFAEGELLLPGVAVRSPGLDERTRRLGDLRLGCEVQVATAEAEKTAFKLMFAAGRVFGLDVCEKMPVTSMDAPGDYDHVVIEDGSRRVQVGKDDHAMVKLGDAGWSNEARIRYVQAAQ